MRSRYRPPKWRASSHENSAVRAPPTCRYPVGEGANRVMTVSVLMGRGIIGTAIVVARNGLEQVLRDRVKIASLRQYVNTSLPRYRKCNDVLTYSRHDGCSSPSRSQVQRNHRPVQRVSQTSHAQHIPMGDDAQQHDDHTDHQSRDRPAAAKISVDHVRIADRADHEQARRRASPAAECRRRSWPGVA